MSIVAGVDFGTLSVRVTLVDLSGDAFSTIEEAQALLCPNYRVVEPDRKAARVYEELYGIFREMYFAFGKSDAVPIAAGHVLSSLRRIATAARGNP